MKSMNMSSATGRRPVSAAPTAAPSKPISLIGVSRTRSGPKRFRRPRVARMIPLHASSIPWSFRPPPPATSSPRTITSGSDSMARWSPSLMANSMGISRSTALIPSRRLRDVLGRRQRRLLGSPHRVVHLGRDLGVDAVEVPGLDQALAHRALGEVHERVALPPRLGLLLRPVGERVADVVAVVAVGLALEERRPLARAGAGDGGARLLVHVEEVHAVGDRARHRVGGGADRTAAHGAHA